MATKVRQNKMRVFSLSPQRRSGERPGERGFSLLIPAGLARKRTLLSPALSSEG